MADPQLVLNKIYENSDRDVWIVQEETHTPLKGWVPRHHLYDRTVELTGPDGEFMGELRGVCGFRTKFFILGGYRADLTIPLLTQRCKLCDRIRRENISGKKP